MARRGPRALTSEPLREVLRPELHELFRATAGRALPHTNVYDERLRLLTRLEDEGKRFTHHNR